MPGAALLVGFTRIIVLWWPAKKLHGAPVVLCTSLSFIISTIFSTNRKTRSSRSSDLKHKHTVAAWFSIPNSNFMMSVPIPSAALSSRNCHKQKITATILSISTSRPSLGLYLSGTPRPRFNPPPISLNSKAFRRALQQLSNGARRRRSLTVRGKGNSVDGPERLLAAVGYFLPFFDGVDYGRFFLTQVPSAQALLEPLIPAIRAYKSFPYASILVFFILYFAVVRNPSISRYVRFNTMQAIVLDVLLIFPDLVNGTFKPGEGIGLSLLISFDNTVFLFLLTCLLYGSTSCLLGQVPRLPLVADAADAQVF